MVVVLLLNSPFSLCRWCSSRSVISFPFSTVRFLPAVRVLPVSMAVLSLLSLLLSHVTRLSFSATAVPSSTCLLPAMVISPAEEIRAACRCMSFPAVMVRLLSFPVTDAAPLFEIAVVCPCPFSSRWVSAVMRMSFPA